MLRSLLSQSPGVSMSPWVSLSPHTPCEVVYIIYPSILVISFPRVWGVFKGERVCLPCDGIDRDPIQGVCLAHIESLITISGIESDWMSDM